MLSSSLAAGSKEYFGLISVAMKRGALDDIDWEHEDLEWLIHETEQNAWKARKAEEVRERRIRKQEVQDELDGKLPVYGRVLEGDYLQKIDHDERIYRPPGLPSHFDDPVTVSFYRPRVCGGEELRYTVMERSDLVFDKDQKRVIVPPELIRFERHPKVFWVGPFHSFVSKDDPEKHLYCDWIH